MNSVDIIRLSDDDLNRLLLPIENQMEEQHVPVNLRAMKGWHLFMAAAHMQIPLLDPASDRVITWFRHRAA